MVVETPSGAVGWLLYDADCSFCVRSARFIAPLLRRHRMDIAPLQAWPDDRRYGVPAERWLDAARFIAADGRQYDAVAAFIEIGRRIPGYRWVADAVDREAARPLFDRWYQWIASNRRCGIQRRSASDGALSG